MRVERSYLIRIVQVYEGKPPADWAGQPFVAGERLDGHQDEHVCNHWELLSDETELLDNDDLDAFVQAATSRETPRQGESFAPHREATP